MILGRPTAALRHSGLLSVGLGRLAGSLHATYHVAALVFGCVLAALDRSRGLGEVATDQVGGVEFGLVKRREVHLGALLGEGVPGTTRYYQVGTRYSVQC